MKRFNFMRQGCWVVFIFLFFLGYCLGEQDVSLKKNRVKRNLWQFGNMIEIATGNSKWSYNSYGCWCGYGGSGAVRDGVDKCCKIHDDCYGDVIEAGCSWHKSPYLVLYDYEQQGDQLVCTDAQGTCDRMTCDCDLQAAECFAQNTYHPELKSDQACGDCSFFGDVRKMKTTGAKSITAQREGKKVIGLVASYRIVDEDVSALETYRKCFEQVGQKYGIHPAVIGALASRVSRGGRNLTTDGYGTLDADRYGLMQCDTNSTLLGSRCKDYGPKSCDHVEMMISEKLIPSIREAMPHYWIYKSTRGQRDAIAAYYHTVKEVQSWSPRDKHTSGGDFSNDVIARAHRLILQHKWSCNGTEDTTPVLPQPGTDNCKNLADRGDCEFYNQCVEKTVPCGNEGYAVGYGYRYCNRFALFYEDFTEEGKQWIDAVRICLMNKLLPHVSKEKTCKQIRNTAFDSHVGCYVRSGPGICSVGLNNKLNLWKVYEIKDFFGGDFVAAWKQVLGTLITCPVRITRDVAVAFQEMINDAVTAFNEMIKELNRQINAFEESLIQEAIGRGKRSTECEQYAQSGDCRFYECFESKFACADHHGYSHVRDFEHTSCMKFNSLSLSNNKVSAWMSRTQQCMMGHLMTLYNQESLDCELVELHMLQVRVSCMVDAGFCSLDPTSEWMIERATDLKGYPFTAPVQYTTLPMSHNTIMVNDYYYETLSWFKTQIGLANEKCFENGERSNENMYKYVDSARYGKLKIRTEL